MIGEVGRALTSIEPAESAASRHTARSGREGARTDRRGRPIAVVRVEGLTLTVRKI
jgi:membrane-bound ClpP family serine protease